MSPQTAPAELPVGHLGFGAMRITGPGIWGRPRDEREAVALLRRVVDRGVAFIDTADSYGPGISDADRQGALSLSGRTGGGDEGRAYATRCRPLGRRLSTRAFTPCLYGQP
jgi:Aldo/keto reductase family